MSEIEIKLLEQGWQIERINSISNICDGSCVLVIFKSKRDGITRDDGMGVDISWLRNGDGDIISTEGVFEVSDIIGWKFI